MWGYVVLLWRRRWAVCMRRPAKTGRGAGAPVPQGPRGAIYDVQGSSRQPPAVRTPANHQPCRPQVEALGRGWRLGASWLDLGRRSDKEKKQDAALPCPGLPAGYCQIPAREERCLGACPVSTCADTSNSLAAWRHRSSRSARSFAFVEHQATTVESGPLQVPGSFLGSLTSDVKIFVSTLEQLVIRHVHMHCSSANLHPQSRHGHGPNQSRRVAHPDTADAA